MGQPRPHPKVAGPQCPPKFLGPPTYAKTVGPKLTKFDMVTRGGVACFWGLPRPRPKGWDRCVTRILGPLRTPKRFDLERQNLI